MDSLLEENQESYVDNIRLFFFNGSIWTFAVSNINLNLKVCPCAAKSPFPSRPLQWQYK